MVQIGKGQGPMSKTKITFNTDHTHSLKLLYWRFDLGLDQCLWTIFVDQKWFTKHNKMKRGRANMY